MSDERLDARGRAIGGKVAMIVGGILSTTALALWRFTNFHSDPAATIGVTGLAIMISGAIMRRTSLREMAESQRELGVGEAQFAVRTPAEGEPVRRGDRE